MSTVVSWCTMSSGYDVYHDSKTSTGATLTGSAPYTPAWSTGFNSGNTIGGLVGAFGFPYRAARAVCAKRVHADDVLVCK